MTSRLKNQWIAFLVVILALRAGSRTVNVSEPFGRLAIRTSPKFGALGVSELLAAELPQRSFELVEREQLATIEKEMELAKLLGSDGVGERLKFGQLAKARCAGVVVAGRLRWEEIDQVCRLRSSVRSWFEPDDLPELSLNCWPVQCSSRVASLGDAEGSQLRFLGDPRNDTSVASIDPRCQH